MLVPAPRVLAVLALAMCSSCAAFRTGALEELDPRTVIDSQPRLPAISYECPLDQASDRSGNFSWNGGWPGAQAERLFCSAFTDARCGPAANDVHIVLRFQEEVRRPVASTGFVVLTILTLGILPTYLRTELTLWTRVECPGRPPRQFEYHENLDVWVTLVMIPWSFTHDGVELRRRSFENMLLHFVRDLHGELPQVMGG